LKNWHAIYTRHRYEKKAEKYLSERGIECYLPILKTIKQWSDRKKLVEMPLFSSYLFVKVDESDYIDVLNAPGVVKYISFEGKAVVIPDKQIENIRWVLSSEVSAEPFHEIIPKGAKVEIIKGPLMGLEAEMVYYNNKKRIVIRLNQLEKSLEIQIPHDHVRVIST
jgi:transcriptional antiterminator RfaH